MISCKMLGQHHGVVQKDRPWPGVQLGRATFISGQPDTAGNFSLGHPPILQDTSDHPLKMKLLGEPILLQLLTLEV